jgi:predicted XRE-type DNA-binding protein
VIGSCLRGSFGRGPPRAQARVVLWSVEGIRIANRREAYRVIYVTQACGSRKGWTQVAAARGLKVPQPTIRKIVNGNIEKLSIEFLRTLMVRAGPPVGISASRKSSSRSAA